MRRRILITTIIAVALLFITQAAMAGTKVYVNLGVPAINFDVRGGGPGDGSFRIQGSYNPGGVVTYPERVYVERRVVAQPEYVWIGGYYRSARPHYVWVPGHWERVSHPRPVSYAPRNDRPDPQHQGWDRNESNYGQGHNGKWDYRN
jgi:hypothetical protein